MKIRYIPQENIDKPKWDRRIKDAPNGLVYAHSWYLDALAKNWDALVLGDYEYIMPLCWRTKLGIKYLFQPGLTPVLGIFGEHIPEEISTQFLQAIPKKFKLWDISLNHANHLPQNHYPVYLRPNYVLPLCENYQTLTERYSSNCQRNRKKALDSGCTIKTGIPVSEVIGLAKEQFRTFTQFDEKNFESLKKIFILKNDDQQAITYGVYSKEEILLASCAFLFSNDRAYYWLVGNAPEAKKVAASFLLIDSFIRDHAGSSMLLDFEGSDNENIAKFYKGFGASNEPYSTIFYSKLPALLSLFKKDPYKKATIL